ncbi:hypothetical protein Goshw_023197 [Gossypium schwendimanii]|uniref:Rho termination factor-like N-terminal domain-containing protein n=1 Tax=Gossypium schwendimanii TaxID=34291 RepID=A0A7J9MDU9_GOSSC|nr:hypothetical protein [Gossypium schwendimanii]
MAAAILSFQSLSRFAPSFPFNKQLKLRKPVLSLTEIADKSVPFSSLNPTLSSTTSDGNTKGSGPKKSSNNAPGSKEIDENEKSSSGIKAPKSSSKEEMIALFRRIQSSISKGKPGRAKSKSFSSSEDKSTAESVKDVFRESRMNVEGTRSKKGTKALRWRSSISKKSKVEKKATVETEEFNLSRPPSNFIKRSPIPHPTALRTKTPERNNEVVSTDGKGSELANMKKLKLSELKELAKGRGIKGYSRLRKTELLQLLMS